MIEIPFTAGSFFHKIVGAFFSSRHFGLVQNEPKHISNLANMIPYILVNKMELYIHNQIQANQYLVNPSLYIDYLVDPNSHLLDK